MRACPPSRPDPGPACRPEAGSISWTWAGAAAWAGGPHVGERGGGADATARGRRAPVRWLPAADRGPAKAGLYGRLFTRPDPDADGELLADLNPNSETGLEECLVEPALAELPVGET